jgi:hypothetical protein
MRCGTKAAQTNAVALTPDSAKSFIEFLECEQ